MKDLKQSCLYRDQPKAFTWKGFIGAALALLVFTLAQALAAL